MTTELRVGTFTPSFLIDRARRDGRFDEAGLSVVEESVSSSPQQFRDLAAGGYDVVFTNPDNVVAYAFLEDNPLGRRLELRVFAGLDRGLGLGLYRGAQVGARPWRLGVDVASSGFALVAYEILARHRLDVAEMTIVELGATPRRGAALIAGECDYTILNAGNDVRAASRGCVLVEPVTNLGPYLGTVLAALAGDDATARAAQNRFRDALVATIADVLAGEREADVLASLGAVLGLDDASARAHLETITAAASGLVAGGRVDRASFATVVDLRQRHRPHDSLDDVVSSLGRVVDADVLA
jgi:ABC-type nitrate/sulfonate/bicarbonate transport system substrate-binding protein